MFIYPYRYVIIKESREHESLDRSESCRSLFWGGKKKYTFSTHRCQRIIWLTAHTRTHFFFSAVILFDGSHRHRADKVLRDDGLVNTNKRIRRRHRCRLVVIAYAFSTPRCEPYLFR